MNNQTIPLYKTIIFATSFCITTHTLTMEQEIAKVNTLDWRSQCVPVEQEATPAKHLVEVNILDWRSQCVPVNIKSTPTDHIKPSIQKNSPLDWRRQCVPLQKKTTPVRYWVNINYELIKAIQNNDVSRVENLFEISRNGPTNDMSINFQYNANNATPLHLAVTQQSPDIVNILLENGADQTIKDKQNNTPDFWLYKNINKGATPTNPYDQIIKNERRFFKIHKILLCNRLEKLNISTVNSKLFI